MAGVWFEGIDELNKLTVALETDAHEVVLKAGPVVAAAAHRVEAAGKQLCPVDTGHLRGSISTDVLGYSGGEYAAEIGPTASYGGYVEWGTERMAPRLYMSGALDQVSPQFADAIAALPNLGHSL